MPDLCGKVSTADKRIKELGQASLEATETARLSITITVTDGELTVQDREGDVSEASRDEALVVECRSRRTVVLPGWV